MKKVSHGFFGMMFATLVLPYLPDVFPFLPFTVAGFNMTGWAWILMLATTLYYYARNPRSNFPISFWIPWVAYLFGYLLLNMSFMGLQLSLQYTLPIFVGVVASGFTYEREDYHWLFKWLLWISIGMLLIFFLSFFTTAVRLGHWAASVIFLSIPATVVLGVYFRTKDIKFLILFAMFFLIPFMMVTRMALLVFIVILTLHFANTRIIYKVFATILGVTVLLFVFNSKEFQEKTFYGGKGEISDISFNYYDADSGILNTSGRVAYLRYFEQGLKESPFFGNGPRADYYIMTAYTDLKEVHNDYLSVRYNYGYVGLALLLTGLVGSFLAVYRKHRRFMFIKEQYGFLMSSIVLTLFIAVFLFMYSDNILKYAVFFPNIFFAMMGMVFAERK